MTAPKAKLAGLALVAVLLVPLTTASCLQVWQLASAAHYSDQAAQWTAADPVLAQRTGGFNASQIDENIQVLRPAAAQDNAEAQFRLGLIMHWFESRTDEGLRLLTAAANQNHVPAQYELGKYYSAIGWAIPARDKVKAYMWYSIAASRGHRCVGKFRYNYAWGWMPQPPLTVPIYEQPMHAKYERIPCAAMERDEIAEKMTPAQISEAQKLAREWRPKK